MEQARSPFQGVKNIVRFNWHFYVIAALAMITCGVLAGITDYSYGRYALAVLLIIVWTVAASLLVSAYIYDMSPLYKFNWLTEFDTEKAHCIVNAHAGFDETSALLQKKYQRASLTVLDFYDPVKHTEVSIKRARKTYPPYPGTLPANAANLNIADRSTDIIFTIFSAHEIRNSQERAEFFRELGRILKDDGCIVVTEHLRDLANFLAYNIGFFHFHSAATWDATFKAAGLHAGKKKKITPFVTTYILTKNGTTS